MTVIAEEAGFRLTQMQMPDGKMVELRVPILPAPTEEVARKALSSFDYDHSIAGVVYSMMGGSATQRLYSLYEVKEFLQKPEEAIDPLEMRHDKIGFVDFGLLASWIDEVIEDHELAAAVRDVAAQESVYGKAMPFIKELLQERLAACKECLAEDDPKTEAPAGAEEVTGPAMRTQDELPGEKGV